jgi:glycosyltransferase involved in cell wall biosynthesis
MKVLYDISVLGAGYYQSRARTGIFRVIENLAYGLKNSKECNLVFCTSGASPRLYDALDYLDSNSELGKVSLAYKNKDLKFRRSIYNRQRELNFKINAIPDSPEVRLKVLRKVLSYAQRSAEFFYKPVSPHILAESDIYHSPFEPIPEKIRAIRNIKKLITVHDLIPIIYPELFQFNEQNTIQTAISTLTRESWVLCVSQATKDDLCNYSKNVDSSKIYVTHLAASELFYPCYNSQEIELTRCKYNIPNGSYILSLSTLEPRKNIDHTIRCFMNLIQQENIQDLYLVLVGTKGWNYDKIFAQISSNPALKDRIIVTGYVADEDLAALYSGALAFVYPSLYEGFGLPPLEAMQCGAPVITSNTSSLPEVVGDAGIMLDPKDADGLCHSMLELYNQPFLRESMSCNSLKQAKNFSWEKCTQQTIQAYKTALSS